MRTFVPLIGPPWYRTSQGGGHGLSARPGQALPRALPMLWSWGRGTPSLSLASLPTETGAPSHPQLKQDLRGPKIFPKWYLPHPPPTSFQLHTSCSFYLHPTHSPIPGNPNPNPLPIHPPPLPTFESLQSARPCPWHLPQEARPGGCSPPQFPCWEPTMPCCRTLPRPPVQTHQAPPVCQAPCCAL